MAYVDQSEIRDHGLDLADDLWLRCSIKRLELHIENRLLLRFLLLEKTTRQQNHPGYTDAAFLTSTSASSTGAAAAGAGPDAAGIAIS